MLTCTASFVCHLAHSVFSVDKALTRETKTKGALFPITLAFHVTEYLTWINITHSLSFITLRWGEVALCVK